MYMRILYFSLYTSLFTLPLVSYTNCLKKSSPDCNMLKVSSILKSKTIMASNPTIISVFIVILLSIHRSYPYILFRTI